MSIAEKIIEFAEQKTRNLPIEEAAEILYEVADNLETLADSLEDEIRREGE